MKNISIKINVQNAEFITAVRLVAGFYSVSIGVDGFDDVEDFKLIVSEAANIFALKGAGECEFTFIDAFSPTVSIKSNCILTNIETECELALSILGALCGQQKITITDEGSEILLSL